MLKNSRVYHFNFTAHFSWAHKNAVAQATYTYARLWVCTQLHSFKNETKRIEPKHTF